ncbi:MAG: ABC transporter ATP-binding protein/permease, partial [Chloroflexota bacterium]|nr:ABC transporter ATP-binding protein/permease [Chloroflexota bacterium]
SLASVALAVLLGFLRLGPAWFIKLIIDQAVPAGDLRLAAVFIAGLLGVAALSNVLNAAELYLQQWVGQRVVYDLRAQLYAHLQQQSMSFYDANQTGQLMSRVTNDVNQVQSFLTQGLTRLVNTVVTLTVNLAIMLYLDPLLTLVAMSVTPVVVFFQLRMATVMDLYRVVARKSAELNVVLQENVTGIKLVKAFDREPYEAERFNRVNWAIREGRMKASMNRNLAGVGQEYATYLSAIIIIVFGAWRVMEGAISVGSITAFYAYVLSMWAPVRWMTFLNQMAQQAVAAGERVFEILDTPLEVAEKPDAVVLGRLAGRIELEDVSFAYGKNPPLLKHISASMEPGQTLALVGPSGSGKTTLINLIPRFYDVTHGKIRIDGHDVRDVTLQSLRSQMGLVMQETFLFNLSIRENISYGRSDAALDEVEAAARAANAHGFISELEQGYDTLVGERGVRLSGGQRQRIAIARAILVDPRILILDEATSSVDNQTDALIRQALDGLMKGRTTLVIAHRLSTVQRAHQILVMEKGTVTAHGTHQELLRKSPLYQHLHEIQFLLHSEHRDGDADGGERGDVPPDAHEALGATANGAVPPAGALLAPEQGALGQPTVSRGSRTGDLRE